MHPVNQHTCLCNSHGAFIRSLYICAVARHQCSRPAATTPSSSSSSSAGATTWVAPQRASPLFGCAGAPALPRLLQTLYTACCSSSRWCCQVQVLTWPYLPSTAWSVQFACSSSSSPGPCCWLCQRLGAAGGLMGLVAARCLTWCAAYRHLHTTTSSSKTSQGCWQVFLSCCSSSRTYSSIVYRCSRGSSSRGGCD